MNKLKPEQYWQWRHIITEMQLSEEKVKYANLQYEIMLKDQEISRLRSALFKTSVQCLSDTSALRKKEYEEFKKQLESDLGISLNGCVIDDVSFEVKKLES